MDDPAAAARGLLDTLTVPQTGPCLVVWRTKVTDLGDHETRMACAGYLVRWLAVWNPAAVLVVLPMGDGVDALDEAEMAAYGWYRRDRPHHPSELPPDGS